MNAPSHDRLIHRLSFRGALVADSAIHVGTGQPGAEEATDMPVARDGRGAPYIPGSSFRGAFRSSLESLLRGLDRAEIRPGCCKSCRQE
jgi:CRISPR/Cas system CSM-associated protein Csm3 (group 7 of RAMP superfamily)